ncbi:hypothetical protein HN682_01630 [Candidatus Peregrinibacteria bacterium]|jgi:hypothetical protein|nr:hypothetical protein [Candidatus Peregrinibacteria bacterium]
MKTNWLANIFNWIGDVFDVFNPAAYRFLSAVLPYTTPIPVAWLTMDSTAAFLNFPPGIAFTFVFGLEGMGLWFTSMFVEAVVDWIKSKNWKTFFIVGLFGAVVAIYVYLLVSLNVKLETATGNTDPILSQVITLLCFLPLLTGIGNGYYKLKLEHDVSTETKMSKKEELEERIRQEKRADRNRRWEIKHGVKVYPSDVQLGHELGQNPSVQVLDNNQLGQYGSNWKSNAEMMDTETLEWITSASAKEIQNTYPVSRSTAYNLIGYAIEELEKRG